MPAESGARWGFHQLDRHIARALVRRSGAGPGNLVLDIGAGRGVITTELLAVGAHVVAVELHPVRAAELRARFRDRAVVVVQADICDLRLPRRPFRVVANPPFSTTAALLRRLVAPGSRLVSADVIVPAPVAARWAAGRAPESDRWSCQFGARIVTRLPARAFRPAAPMATAVLRVERHGSGAADPQAPPVTTDVPWKASIPPRSTPSIARRSPCSVCSVNQSRIA